MARISLDRFETGADNPNDLMITMSYEVGQRGANVFLIVGNQDAHMFLQKFSCHRSERITDLHSGGALAGDDDGDNGPRSARECGCFWSILAGGCGWVSR